MSNSANRTVYQRLIVAGTQDADPRRIEAQMRLEHATLDGLSAQQFADAVHAALMAALEAGPIESEALAASFGLWTLTHSAKEIGMTDQVTLDRLFAEAEAHLEAARRWAATHTTRPSFQARRSSRTCRMSAWSDALPGHVQTRTGMPVRVTARPMTIRGRPPRWSLEWP